jgi:hypothetical protein
MKTKKPAKPVKGSARAKRFMDGGAIGALAGLGTLAYLLHKGKDKDKDKAPEVDAGKARAMAQSRGRPDMGTTTPEMFADKDLKRTEPYEPVGNEGKQDAFSKPTMPKYEPSGAVETTIGGKAKQGGAAKPDKPGGGQGGNRGRVRGGTRRQGGGQGSKPSATGQSNGYLQMGEPTPEMFADKDSKRIEPPAENTYGIGPHGAFAGIHEAIANFQTPMQRAAAERRKAAEAQSQLASKAKGGKITVKKMAKGGMAAMAMDDATMMPAKPKAKAMPKPMPKATAPKKPAMPKPMPKATAPKAKPGKVKPMVDELDAYTASKKKAKLPNTRLSKGVVDRKGMPVPTEVFKGGGPVKSRGDGCAIRGRTKTKYG